MKFATLRLLTLAFFSLSLIDSMDSDSQPPSAPTKIHLGEASRIPVGVAYCAGKRNAKTTPIIDGEFSRLTSTEFYPFLLWQAPGQYRFSGADQSVADAQRSRRPLHGHCLLYALESVCPPFLINFEGTNQEFEAMVRDYLTVTLTRYKGRVQSYDLANELFAYHGNSADNTWLRRRFTSDQELWDFIGRCYHYAHAADPDALLFYADYGQESSRDNYAKGWAIAHQLFRWKKAGVPVHGYALHFHTNIYRPQQDLDRALTMAVQTGLKIHVSELDVSINWSDGDVASQKSGVQGLTQATPDLLERQSETFRHIALAYRRLVPAQQQFGITVWDVGDGDSWLASQRFEKPTLFDGHYRPKPAFYGFMRGLSEAP